MSVSHGRNRFHVQKGKVETLTGPSIKVELKQYDPKKTVGYGYKMVKRIMIYIGNRRTPTEGYTSSTTKLIYKTSK